MNKTMQLLAVMTAAALGIALIGNAFGQASSDPKKVRNSTTIVEEAPRLPQQVQSSTTITGRQSEFDLETRVEILEREVARLRDQVNFLTAQHSDTGIRYTGPIRRVQPPSGENSGDSEDSGPRLKLPSKDGKD
jgi:hypothetical protein